MSVSRDSILAIIRRNDGASVDVLADEVVLAPATVRRHLDIPEREGLIDHIEVRNLAEALEALSKSGFQTVGLDSEGPAIIEKSITAQKVALVLGAEGKGLRQKTRETVDVLARLDMPGAIRSLNVSNAAVLSLYVARHIMVELGNR